MKEEKENILNIKINEIDNPFIQEEITNLPETIKDILLIRFIKRIGKSLNYIEEIKKERVGLSVSEYMGKWRDIVRYYESGAIINDLSNILKGDKDE